MARTKIKFGYSANDNEGAYLREGAEQMEEALSELYMFMTGQASDTTLKIAIPKVSGGTGASTDKQHQDYVGYYAARIAQPIMVKNIPIAVCTVGYGREPTTKLLTELTDSISFIKLGVGSYKVNVFDEIIKVENDYVFVCPDNLGNRAVTANVRYEGKSIFIDTYPVRFDQGLGLFVIDDSNGTVDVPDNTYMTFTLVNSLGIVL